jgi:hypothetical protein
MAFRGIEIELDLAVLALRLGGREHGGEVRPNLRPQCPRLGKEHADDCAEAAKFGSTVFPALDLQHLNGVIDSAPETLGPAAKTKWLERFRGRAANGVIDGSGDEGLHGDVDVEIRYASFAPGTSP